ncbi:MAG: carbamoyltransferase HypF [Candidatus Altiarchaeota archaeon]|nr:carbamoyltransferase HypF [Candidatus Altiarchaeota archaeon]
MVFYRFFVEGVVQGVGFRPYIYRRANGLGLLGCVKNTGAGVEIIVNDKDFMERLSDLPPLAKITGYTVGKYRPKRKYSDFTILKSSRSEGVTQIPPDIFTCKECIEDLKNPNDRRHSYYFITCTNCGPRFTIIEDYPYDRPLTSMNEFKMCKNCSAEYLNPLDRRYHAQTIACKKCGPKLKLLDRRKDVTAETDAKTIEKAVELIMSGEFVSIKGVGGFHISCIAEDDAVSKVRKFLGRPHKPFALMVKDVCMAEKLVHVPEKERQLLESPQRPIVVLKKKKSMGCVSELDSLGVMLPYTALHYLLFDFIAEPLVMTSCNVPGEPVATDETLGRYFLTHERRIVNRCDDSVLKVVGGNVSFLRRSRGYTPSPLSLPIDCIDTVSVGAEINSVVAAAKGRDCFLSQYIGDTTKLETSNFMRQSVEKLVKLTRVKPEIIACDMHPGYNSTSYAKELSDGFDAELVPLQHHRCHVASVAAEHGLTDYVGVAVDGLGYGDDGTIWGGEVFDVSGGIKFKRVGSLMPQPQLGGDSAAMHPKKMLYGILSNVLTAKELHGMSFFPKKEMVLYDRMLAEGFNTPLTSSAGRILDAASALLGLCSERTYDGRPAMLLESKATKPILLEPVYTTEDGVKRLDTSELFRFMVENRAYGVGQLAATAQMYLARGLYGIASSYGKPVVLSGGVAYNQMIANYMVEKGVFVNRDMPSGDGGICFGQTYLSNLTMHS